MNAPGQQGFRHPPSRKTPRSALVGQFFHSRERDALLDAPIKWQGRVLSEEPHGHFLVELFSWTNGQPNGRHVVSIESMTSWDFFQSVDDMTRAYEDYVHRRKIASQPEKLYEKIAEFATRIGVAKRTVFAMAKRGEVLTVGQGSGVRVDVKRSLASMSTKRIDDAPERAARASAARAARRSGR